MLFVFTFNSGSVPNRHPSPLPKVGLSSLSSFRGEGVTHQYSDTFKHAFKSEHVLVPQAVNFFLFKLRGLSG